MFDIRLLDQNWENDEVKQLVRALKHILSAGLDVRAPIKIRHYGDGPVFDIAEMSSAVTLIRAINQTGQEVALGFGMGSRGIVANEFVPDPNFAIDAFFVRQSLSTNGNTPRDPQQSGYNVGTSGSGVPNTLIPFEPVSDWTRGLVSLQRSTDTEHPTASADKFTRDGQVSWLVRKPSHWMVLRATVTAINDDTLACSIIAHGKVIAENVIVAKPCTLQRTPWDGVTVDGITYTYSDSQTRTVDDGSYAPFDEVIDPPYVLDGPCPQIYIHWVGNQTDIADVYWIDLNADARHWVPL